MSFLTFNINKNHIFFLLLFVSYFLRNLVKEFLKTLDVEKRFIFGNTIIAKRAILEIYTFTPSNLLVFFLFFVEKIRAKKNNIKDALKANTKDVKLIYNERTLVNISKLIKLIFLTSIFFFIPKILTFFLYFFVNDDGKFSFVPILISANMFYIFATSLLSRFFLSRYFYRHHFVSLALNIICLIINAIIEITYLKNIYNIILYIINILNTIIYSFSSVTGKFLLKFISPYALVFYLAIMEIIYLGILFIPLYFIKRNGENIFSNFFDTFDGYKFILLDIAYYIIFCSYNIFIWIIIDKFSPNDYGLSIMIETMIDKLY